MEAIKTKAIAHKGVLTIPVPKEFEEKELDVIILSDNNKNESEELEDYKKQQHEEKVKRLMSIVGKAKFPDFPITKYDVYDQ